MILLKNKIETHIYTPSIINITENWLLGFLEGDGMFSTVTVYRPRLKLECHINTFFLNSRIFWKRESCNVWKSKR